MDGSYAAKETHDLPEILARQWAASGYCRIIEQVVSEPIPEPATPPEPAPAARPQRFKAVRNRTPDADLL